LAGLRINAFDRWSARAMTFDPIPTLPAAPTPGALGQFAFLTGEWRIANRSIIEGEWREYPGEASVAALLDGAASIEELRIPARNFSGMAVRLLDRENLIWSDHWINAARGAITAPAQTGSFENSVGIFTADYSQDGRTVKAVGVWDQITPHSCRWRQATSADGGCTWEQNWIMHWTRV
jgi:hypothetical protein